MVMTDPVADMLTRIRNAVLRQHAEVIMPFSNIKESIAKTLLNEGFIKNYSALEEKDSFKQLVIQLSYDDQGESIIRKIKRVSKPGYRVQKPYKSIQNLLNGQGVFIVSTSKGVLSDRECQQQKVGGEILCSVY